MRGYLCTRISASQKYNMTRVLSKRNNPCASIKVIVLVLDPHARSYYSITHGVVPILYSATTHQYCSSWTELLGKSIPVTLIKNPDYGGWDADKISYRRSVLMLMIITISRSVGNEYRTLISIAHIKGQHKCGNIAPTKWLSGLVGKMWSVAVGRGKLKWTVFCHLTRSFPFIYPFSH